MTANFDLPIPLERLSQEELTVLTLRSAQTGKSTSDVILDAVRSYAKRPSLSGPSLASSPVQPVNPNKEEGQ